MDKVLPSAEIKAIIETEYELVPLGRERHGTARRYRFADGKGEIGFISPVTEPFCGDCNRIRLTAEGMLRTCLFSMNETDLRAPLRDGRERRRARADRARRGLAQGAQAPRRRAGLRPAGALDVADRRVSPAAPGGRRGLGAGRGGRRAAARRARAARPTRPGGSPPRTRAARSTCRRSTAPRWTATPCARPTPTRRARSRSRARWRRATCAAARSSRAPRSGSRPARRCPTAPTRSCASRTRRSTATA